MKKYSSAVEDYFKNVIKKSWTWGRLTPEEQQRFIDMDVFDEIKGSDKTRIEWFNTIYKSFLVALGYKPLGWREHEKEKHEEYEVFIYDESVSFSNYDDEVYYDRESNHIIYHMICNSRINLISNLRKLKNKYEGYTYGLWNNDKLIRGGIFDDLKINS